jgi:hypothetical protein
MSEIIPQNLHYTVSYLVQLLNKDGNLSSLKDASTSELLQQLTNSLSLDGFELQSRSEEVVSQSLSGLLEHGRRLQLSGNSVVMDLVLVFVCVICAGLASGLTQVFSLLFNLHLI